MNSLYLLDDFAQHFHFLYANTNALKRESYQLRSKVEGTDCKPSAFQPARLNIDQYDAHSHHILLQDKNTKRFVATARIIEPPANNPRKSLPIEEGQAGKIWISGVPIRTLPSRSYSEMSQLNISATYPLLNKNKHCSDEKINLGLCLASFCLARLLFHQYMLAELTIDQFKKLRASGLLFEQTSELSADQNKRAIFYLNLESGIKPTNPVYALQQHILNEIAHQVNNPVVNDSYTGNVSSSQ